jgi:hypothetical protein
MPPIYLRASAFSRLYIRHSDIEAQVKDADCGGKTRRSAG